MSFHFTSVSKHREMVLTGWIVTSERWGGPGELR